MTNITDFSMADDLWTDSHNPDFTDTNFEDTSFDFDMIDDDFSDNQGHTQPEDINDAPYDNSSEDTYEDDIDWDEEFDNLEDGEETDDVEEDSDEVDEDWVEDEEENVQTEEEFNALDDETPIYTKSDGTVITKEKVIKLDAMSEMVEAGYNQMKDVAVKYQQSNNEIQSILINHKTHTMGERSRIEKELSDPYLSSTRRGELLQALEQNTHSQQKIDEDSKRITAHLEQQYKEMLKVQDMKLKKDLDSKYGVASTEIAESVRKFANENGAPDEWLEQNANFELFEMLNDARKYRELKTKGSKLRKKASETKQVASTKASRRAKSATAVDGKTKALKAMESGDIDYAFDFLED